MKAGRASFPFGRVLLGLACGIATGPLVVFAGLVVRSEHLVREYEVALLSDGAAESEAITVRIDGTAPVRRQHIDLPSVPPRRLSLFEPYGRRTPGAVLDIVRRDEGGTTVLRQVQLEFPRGDTRCIVVVTVEAGMADTGPCRSLLRYM